MNGPQRLQRESRTVEAMIRIFCRRFHRQPRLGRTALCPSCAELLRYALGRIDRCPYGGGKPVCARCPVHCYRPGRREEIRRVMRWAGPRMIVRHPLLALGHLADRLARGREPPARPA